MFTKRSWNIIIFYSDGKRITGTAFIARETRSFVIASFAFEEQQGYSEDEYDVLMEVWYPDEETLKACGEKLSEPDIAKEIREDEEKIFDTRFMRSYTVDEFESELKIL